MEGESRKATVLESARYIERSKVSKEGIPYQTDGAFMVMAVDIRPH